MLEAKGFQCGMVRESADLMVSACGQVDGEVVCLYEDLDSLSPDHELLVASIALEDRLEDVYCGAEEGFECLGRSKKECRYDCILEFEGALLFGALSESVGVDDVCLFLVAA